MGILFNRNNKKNLEEKFQEKRNIVAAEYVIEQHFGVFADSLKLLETTTNPRTFFGRYDDLLGAVEKVIETSRAVKLKETEEKGLKIIEDITSEETKTGMIKAFIDRCIDADKADVLRDEMSEYMDKMTAEAIQYLAAKVGEI